MKLQVEGVADSQASLLIIDEVAGVTTQDTVRCQNGAIIDLPLAFPSLLLSDYLDGLLNTYHEDGITSPSYQTLEENGWTYSWEVEKLVEQPVQVQPEGFPSGFILRNNSIGITSETSGEHGEVSVPAGDFPEAVLVSVELRVPVTIGNSSANFSVEYTEWYAPYVGLLKIQTDGASLDYVGAPIPLPLEQTLELIAYTQSAEQ
jgi:hypothetical protein